jgi:hypothetical protein
MGLFIFLQRLDLFFWRQQPGGQAICTEVLNHYRSDVAYE